MWSAKSKPGMSDLGQKWVRLAPNGTNAGLFQIRFQYILPQALFNRKISYVIGFYVGSTGYLYKAVQFLYPPYWNCVKINIYFTNTCNNRFVNTISWLFIHHNQYSFLTKIVEYNYHDWKKVYRVTFETLQNE